MACPIRPIVNRTEHFSGFFSTLSQNAYQYWVNKYIEPVDELLMERVQKGQILEALVNYQLDGKSLENHASTRSMFIIKIFQLVNKLPDTLADKGEEIFKIAALGEYDMAIMYHENHIRDQKYGVRNDMPETVSHKAELKRRLIQHKEEFLHSNFTGIVGEKIKVANQFMHEVHDLIGMMLDKDFTTINGFRANYYPKKNIQDKIQALDSYGPYMNVFEKDATPAFYDLVNAEEFMNTLGTDLLENTGIHQKSEYLKLYFSRCFLLNVIFYHVYAKLILTLYGDSSTDHEEVMAFARHFGLVQQMVNDISDFVPVDQGFSAYCKKEEDTFNDLRERTVTLPVMYFLTQNVTPHSGIEAYLSEKNNALDLRGSQDQHLVLSRFLNSGAISSSISLVEKLAESAQKMIDPNAQATLCLTDLLSYAFDNKYYQFYQSYQHASTPTKLEQTESVMTA